jgi:asparagine synthase (glutamine-hydrolysing)
MAVMSESALSAASLLDDGAASDSVGPWVAVLGPDADRAAHHLRPGDDGRLVLRAVGPGRAPSVGRSGDRKVIFDGQLHNAHDLARALAAPAGTPAADLVARAHERWGDASLQRLKGTFACANLDCRYRTLKLVRDPVGTYPFFFSESCGRIAFGVDAEPLLSLPWVSRALNRAAIADHLSHRWLSWHETHYQDLSRVPAGFVVTWQDGTRRFERYWYPVDPSGNVEWVREDALDQFQESLRTSHRAMPWPGSAAIFLSGGFDSVSIGVTAAELSRRRVPSTPDRGLAVLPGSDVR